MLCVVRYDKLAMQGAGEMRVLNFKFWHAFPFPTPLPLSLSLRNRSQFSLFWVASDKAQYAALVARYGKIHLY